MDSRALAAAAQRLTSFLDAFMPLLGRAERGYWATMYVRGLLLDGERKSIEPMVDRLPGAEVQAVRQLVNQSPWAWAPVQEALTRQLIDRLLPEAVLILDETSFPKQGTHSVGVARQYCGALGKTANCQVAVSLHLGTDTGCVPLVWKLYLPDEWTDDPARRAEAGIPPTITYRTKTELALDALDVALARGVGRRVVLADSAYGNSFDFRAALTARDLPYCVQVEPTTKAWTAPPAPSTPPPYQGQGRPRRRPPRADLPVPEDLATLALAVPAPAWHHVTWRPGSKGPLRSRFARCAVWLAHRWTTTRTVRTTAVDLLIEWPRDEPAPTKYWLAELRGESAGLRRLVRLAKGRWRIEMDYRELKEEVGLDHFEGRSWTGWHHHVTLATLAYAFLVLETLRGKKNGDDDVTPDSRVAATPAGTAR
jgi:SRSO17 transposase